MMTNKNEAKPQKSVNMKKIAILSLSTLLLYSCITIDRIGSVITATIDGKPITATLIFAHTAGDQKVIDLSSPLPWQLLSIPQWLQISHSTGNGNQVITIKVTTDNNGTAPLTGEIVFEASNGDKLTIRVQQNGDIYAAFKADDTPRWQVGFTIEQNHETAYTFIIDSKGKLFSSPFYKTGRISKANGSSFEVLEFPGPPVTGRVNGAQIRRESGVVELHRFEIIKIEGPKLWMVFQETDSSAERWVVQ